MRLVTSSGHLGQCSNISQLFFHDFAELVTSTYLTLHCIHMKHFYTQSYSLLV